MLLWDFPFSQERLCCLCQILNFMIIWRLWTVPEWYNKGGLNHGKQHPDTEKVSLRMDDTGSYV